MPRNEYSTEINQDKTFLRKIIQSAMRVQSIYYWIVAIIIQFTCL